jgi:hypothetical protein
MDHFLVGVNTVRLDDVFNSSNTRWFQGTTGEAVTAILGKFPEHSDAEIQEIINAIKLQKPYTRRYDVDDATYERVMHDADDDE